MAFTLQQRFYAVLLALGLHALALVSINRIEPGQTLAGLEGFDVTVMPPPALASEAARPVEEALEEVEEVEEVEELEEVELIEPVEVARVEAVEVIEIEPEPAPVSAPVIVVKQKIVKKTPVKKQPSPARIERRDTTETMLTERAQLSQGYVSDRGVSATFKASYRATISAILKRHKRYPSRALTRRQEGTVAITFVVNKDGKLAGYRITHSSGYRLLDREVEKMLKRAAPFPPFPIDMEQEFIRLSLPVDFYIKS